MDAARDRLLSIRATKIYTTFQPAELNELYVELKAYLCLEDSQLSEISYLFLMEMLFHVEVYLSKDIEAEVIYNTLRDEFGEHAPSLYVMKATLLQINESDQKAIDYINRLFQERLEFDTDSNSYLVLQKKLLSMQLATEKKEAILKKALSLSEIFPMDPELWWFIGEIYMKFGKFDEAAFSFEEVILLQPFNYVAFVQIAETLYYKANRLADKLKSEERKTILLNALNNALRSVELNELFLKGWSMVAVIANSLDEKEDILALSYSKLNEIVESKNTSTIDKNTARLIINRTK